MAWISKMVALFRRDRLSDDHEEELRYHLSRLAEMKTGAGLAPEDAAFAARRQFGNPTRLKEEMRDADLLTLLESLMRDLRFGARMLFKNPGFTAIAVLALSVGIGVNTAVFTAYKAILFEQLDAKDAGRLVNIYRTTGPDQYRPTFSYPDFEFLRDQNRVFSGLMATTGDEPSLTGIEYLGGARNAAGDSNGVVGALGFSFPSLMHGGAEYVSSLAVSENYFAVLGVNAFAGRVFTPQDSTEFEQHPAVLISENYWQRRFGGNIAILGKSIQLNGSAFTVIGITPHDFRGTNINVPNFWIPLRSRPLLLKSGDVLHDREDFCCALYGRLAQGVSLSQAQAEMNVLAGRVQSLHTPRSDEANKPAGILLTAGSHIAVFQISRNSGLIVAVLLVMGAAALVLLIACANVASLQLARSAARQREMGVRLSVGASRGRIIQQLLTESVLLGLLAAVTSVLMAWGSLHMLMIEISASLPTEWGNVALHVEPDALVFCYVFAVSVVAGIVFGLTPALEASRPDIFSATKEAGAWFGLPLSNARLRYLLVATQVTISLFLLIAAGLLIRGSMRGTSMNPGYETHNSVWLNINFPSGFDFTPAQQLAETRQLRDRIQNIPGVLSIASGNAPDSGGLRDAAIGLDGAKPPTLGATRTLFYSYVSANYFKTLGIPLLSGSGFSADATAPEPVVILSESAANELWPGLNPIGRILSLDASHQFHGGSELIPSGSPLRVIGIAANTAGITPGNADAVKVYLPVPNDRVGEFPLVFRTKSNSQRFFAQVSKQIQTVDPRLVVYAEPLDQLMTSTPNFVISRLAAIFAALIGCLGLLLACVGIYGAVSYAVVRRTREMGIRMALGAQKPDVLRMILSDSSHPVLAGLCIGIALAAAASRLLRTLLYGLSALDPLSFLGISALFLLVALFAAYFPARRATMVDPVVALRGD